jgi:hypothetical protein
MTAVDTGWINDENPRERAARTAEAGRCNVQLEQTGFQSSCCKQLPQTNVNLHSSVALYSKVRPWKLVHHFQTPLDEVDAAARVLHPAGGLLRTST